MCVDWTRIYEHVIQCSSKPSIHEDEKRQYISFSMPPGLLLSTFSFKKKTRHFLTKKCGSYNPLNRSREMWWGDILAKVGWQCSFMVWVWLFINAVESSYWVGDFLDHLKMSKTRHTFCTSPSLVHFHNPYKSLPTLMFEIDVFFSNLATALFCILRSSHLAHLRKMYS